MTQRRASRRAATAQSLAGGAQEAHGLSSFRPEGAAERGGPITALLTADQQALRKRDPGDAAPWFPRSSLSHAGALLHTYQGSCPSGGGGYYGVLPLSLQPGWPCHCCGRLVAFWIGLYRIQPLDLTFVGPLLYFLCCEVIWMLCPV